MPKRVLTMNDFSGGMNDTTDKRDLAPNEAVTLKNLDPRGKGRLVASTQFASNPTDIGGQGIEDDGAAVPAGYGLFRFSSDYKLSDSSTGFGGEFYARIDGTDVNVYETGTATGWQANIMTSCSNTTPAFYSGDGNLFCGGSHSDSHPPKSAYYINRVDFPGVGGAVNERAITQWHHDVGQARTAPVEGTGAGQMAVYSQYAADSSDTDATIGADGLAWVVVITSVAGRGWAHDWDNDGDDGARTAWIDCAGTWVYNDGSESAMTTLTIPAITSGAHNNKNISTNAAVKIYAMMDSVTDTETDVAQRIRGARLYVRTNTGHSPVIADEEYYMVAEADWEKGIIGESEFDWAPWAAATTYGGITQCNTGTIMDPPAVYSYFANNGYAIADIPTNRLVYWKTGTVINSRAYVGNVKINGRVYPDRILKSPAYQYDIFTENNWIEGLASDGDEIVKLESFADRILVFKKNTVLVMNVSETDEFIESEQKGAGVDVPAAVTSGHFGIAWVNKSGCYMYTGEHIISLLFKKGEKGSAQTISDTSWSGNISSTPAIGYDGKKRQLIVVWNTSAANNAYIFSFDTQSWHYTSDLVGGWSSGISNMISGRDNNLYLAGGFATNDFSGIATRAGNPSATFETGEISFGNYESKKNLSKIVITYQGGSSQNMGVYGSVNGGAYGSSLGTMNGGTGRQTLTIDLTGNADYKGQKTFQFKLDGTANSAFVLEDITFIYRDLGVR